MAEAMVNCPFCEERGKSPDTKQHLYIYGKSGENGVHCFRCNYHRDKGMPKKVAELLDLADFFDAPGESFFDETKVLHNIEQLTDCFRPALQFRRARRYLNERGVSDDQIAGMELLYAPTGRYADRVIFPLYDNQGRVDWFIAGSISGREPKYLNAPGDKGGRVFVFGNPAGNDVAVAEGWFSAFACAKAGFAAVALAGKRISAAQCITISSLGARRVIVAVESDAFHSGVDVALRLSKYVPTARRDLPIGQDPDDILKELGPEVLHSILATRSLSALTAEVLGEEQEEESYRGVRTVRRKPENISKDRRKFKAERRHSA